MPPEARACADCGRSVDDLPAHATRCGDCYRRHKAARGVARTCAHCGQTVTLAPESSTLRVPEANWTCSACFRGDPVAGVDLRCTDCGRDFRMPAQLAARLDLSGSRPVWCPGCRSTRAAAAAGVKSKRERRTLEELQRRAARM